jgi:hypothetical protein
MGTPSNAPEEIAASRAASPIVARAEVVSFDAIEAGRAALKFDIISP